MTGVIKKPVAGGGFGLSSKPMRQPWRSQSPIPAAPPLFGEVWYA